MQAFKVEAILTGTELKASLFKLQDHGHTPIYFNVQCKK